MKNEDERLFLIIAITSLWAGVVLSCGLVIGIFVVLGWMEAATALWIVDGYAFIMALFFILVAKNVR